MAGLQFAKVSEALPGTLAPSTVYFVKKGTDRVEQFITDNTGTQAFRVTPEEPLEPFLLMGVGSE